MSSTETGKQPSLARIKGIVGGEQERMGPDDGHREGREESGLAFWVIWRY